MGREGDQEAIGDESLDARKAAGWSLLAAIAQLALVSLPRSSPLFAPALALAYPLMLPAIAVMHARHRRVRESGSVLATSSGIVVVVVGAIAAYEPALEPVALIALSVWWWTIGKMWVETNVLARALGLATAGLGVLAALAGLLFPIAPSAVLGAWLVVLAAGLWQRADVPSA